MDYAFTNAINFILQTTIVLLIYDIVCQFIKNFRKRVDQVPEYLNIPENLQIKKAIGLFHVHGHVNQCFARYAPTFIRGAGMLVGEIIETLWSPLNHTASSARSMSWYHRQEYLDAHMGDSNWKKLTSIGETLSSPVRLITRCGTNNVQYQAYTSDGRSPSRSQRQLVPISPISAKPWGRKEQRSGCNWRINCRSSVTPTSRSWINLMFTKTKVGT